MSIDLKSVADRLRELDLFLSIQDVASAADALMGAIPPIPAAFVYTSSERAEPNRMATGAIRQRVSATVGILFALGAERADRARADPAEAARNAILDQLLGWRPAGAERHFEYSSFSIREISDGLLWGEVLMAAPWFLSKRL